MWISVCLISSFLHSTAGESYNILTCRLCNIYSKENLLPTLHKQKCQINVFHTDVMFDSVLLMDLCNPAMTLKTFCRMLFCVSTGCTLSVTNYDEITVYSGQSVLLTCSCTEPQAKPPSVTWTKLNQQPGILTKPSQDSLYRDRVKMFNNNSPGNLSVLLSHVTEDDVGWYRCGISHAYRDIKLTVKGKRRC